MKSTRRNQRSRMLGLGVIAALAASTFTVVTSTQAGAKDANRFTLAMSRAMPPRADGVQAVLLDSNSQCLVTDAWSTINAQWARYGSVPVSVSTGGNLCMGHFTLGNLKASGADTVILSDTAWLYQLTPNEILSLQQYASEGHTLLGVGVDFSMRKHDNNALAPLFGLTEQTVWRLARYRDGPPAYKLRHKNPAASVLFRDVTDPYVSSGAPFGEKPADSHWSANDLSGATIAGVNKHGHAAITVYATATHAAIYITNEADFASSTDDLQFLYNALIYPNRG